MPAELLSIEEVWTAEPINKEVVREAYEQVSQRLADVLDAKKTFEQKALSLFAAYVTVALAAFGLAANAASETSPVHEVFGALCGIGLCFAAGAFMFVAALWDANYGTLGSAPETWMRKDVLMSDDEDAVWKVTATVVRRHHERIAESVASNAFKAWFIRVGMLLGAFAPLCLLAQALLSRH